MPLQQFILEMEGRRQWLERARSPLHEERKTEYPHQKKRRYQGRATSEGRLLGGPHRGARGSNFTMAGNPRAVAQWMTGTPSGCRRTFSSQTLLLLVSEMRLDFVPQQWTEWCGSEAKHTTSSGPESSWQITTWFVITWELSQSSFLKESIPGGTKTIFLETPGWVIYFKWVESLFMLAPLQMHWVVIYTKTENAIISSNRSAPSNSCTLQFSVINSSTPYAKSPIQKTIPNPSFSTTAFCLQLVLQLVLCSKWSFWKTTCYTFQSSSVEFCVLRHKWSGQGRWCNPILQMKKLKL
jgi:hypothetical protein